MTGLYVFIVKDLNPLHSALFFPPLDDFDGVVDGLVAVLALEGVGSAVDDIVVAVRQGGSRLVELFVGLRRKSFGAADDDDRYVAA